MGGITCSLEAIAISDCMACNVVQQTFLAEKAEGKASMAIFAHYV